MAESKYNFQFEFGRKNVNSVYDLSTYNNKNKIGKYLTIV